jgi:hypothetical protein
MGTNDAIDLVCRGPGVTRRQHLRFSADSGLEGTILRPYQYIGLSRRWFRMDPGRIEKLELEAGFNIGAAIGAVALVAAAFVIGWVALTMGEDRVFWAIVIALDLLAAAEAAGAAWWAELRIIDRNRRRTIVPVAGPSRAAAERFASAVMAALDRDGVG